MYKVKEKVEVEPMQILKEVIDEIEDVIKEKKLEVPIFIINNYLQEIERTVEDLLYELYEAEGYFVV